MSQRYIGGLIYNPPGGYSGYFDGTGDYLSVADNAALELGGSDFCIEGWYFPQSFGSNLALVSKRANTTSTGAIVIYANSGSGALTFYASANGSSYFWSGSTIGTMALNQWNHFAVYRSGNNWYGSMNGVVSSMGSSANSIVNNTDAYTIGGDTNGNYANGYISNTRIVIGASVYGASNFTPPVGPLQAISGTQLLTCRYPTFVDGSSNAFTITVNGNTTVSTQNPFPLTTLPNPAQGNAGNGIFSMSQYQSLKQQNLWPAIDPYFDYTTLLLHGNGTNGGQNNTFLDSGTANSGSGFTITRNGNTTQGTFSPFSQTGWSNYFDGSGDSLSLSSTALNLGSNNFTVEAWVYTNTTGEQCVVGSVRNYDGVGAWMFNLNYNSAKLRFFCRYGGGTVLDYTADAGTFPTSQWTHIAVTRSGANLRMFLNGTQLGTTNTTLSTSSIDNAGTNYYIGQTTDGASYFNGYISNLRVLTGTALYTANFTPPTAPLTAVTNTTLLTCQSNRFVDNSASPLTLTPAGNTSVQAFSPFAPTAAYSASTVGGSGYFDGTGDYLTVETAAESALNLTGTFTFEFWFYRNATGDIQLFSKGGGQNNWNTTNGIAYQALIETSTFKWQFSIGGGSLVSIDVTAPAISQWVHVAVGRNGTTTRVWVNGSSIGTSTSTPTPPSTRNIIYAAANQTGGNNVNGYMAGLRIVNGTDVYGVSNTSITVPTSPPTNISNTSLLLNFTNAAIIDNTAKNVLETVGNAQISTTQSKFGGASLYFDGSGDWLTIPYSQNINFGTGSFTIEGWFYLSSFANQYYVLGGTWTTGTSDEWLVQIENNGTIRFLTTAGTSFYSAGITTGAWYHFAAVRNGSTIALYVNGTSVGSYSNSNSIGSSSKTLYIGVQNNGSAWPWNGYIDDLRITKGIARYTSNFTPQTSQWQDQ